MKNKKTISTILLACMMLLAAIASGCGSAKETTGNETTGNETKQETVTETVQETSETEAVQTGAVTFIDDLGRQVTVENPKRVISLIASYADIWYLAGGIDTLVGTTNATWTYFDLPLREDIVNLGSSKELNQEQLLACEPDFVLASCGTDRNVELETFFEEAGLNVAYFSVNSFEDYLRVLNICTTITGCEDNYTAYGTNVEKEVDEALSRVDGRAPTVLYVRASGKSCKVKNSEGSVLGEIWDV